MKKPILLALTAITFAGCESRPTKEVDGMTVVTIDSCEYISFSTYMGTGYAHKGNCRFCTERRKQELKELVEQLKNK